MRSAAIAERMRCAVDGCSPVTCEICFRPSGSGCCASTSSSRIMRPLTCIGLFRASFGGIGSAHSTLSIPRCEMPAIIRRMRVGLFVTCLVDLMRPRIGFAALKLLEAAGCEVVVPQAQTCCGQPGYNSGDRASAKALARKLLAEFEGCEYVVAPSGSCTGMIRTHYPDLFSDQPTELERVRRLCDRTYELTDFLLNVAKLDRVPGSFNGTVTYHDSCS